MSVSLWDANKKSTRLTREGVTQIDIFIVNIVKLSCGNATFYVTDNTHTPLHMSSKSTKPEPRRRKVAPAYVVDKTKTDKQNAKLRKRHNSLMRRAVYEGKYEKTRGGLLKGDLAKSKSGKIVSKKQMERAKRSGLGVFLRNKKKKIQEA